MPGQARANQAGEPAETLTEELRHSYDSLPYENLPRYDTHPDSLATAARLRGLEAPPVESARVLELGCSTGVNLLALAVALPNGRYTGIDLSATQIDAAQALAGTLGLEQVRFEAADLRTLASSVGEFDYVVCHGVFSHVPPDTQDAILAICARGLAANGVACVSYNTYPGWALRGLVRDLLRRRAHGLASTLEAVAAGRQLLSLLARHAQPARGWYAAALADEQRLLEDSDDAYVAHEHLDPVNEPLHLTDFVGRARAHGLEYLGDALPEPLPEDLPGGLGAALSALARDPLERDQYLDYFVGRAFRSTLLCRAGTPLRGLPPVETVRRLVARAQAVPDAASPDLRSGVVERFGTRDGRAAESSDPLVKALLTTLYRHAPAALGLDDLRTEVRALMAAAGSGHPGGDDPAAFAEALLRLHAGQLLRLQTHAVAFATSPGERPRASSLARAQARAGALVTSLRHDNLSLQETERSLLVLLDGTRDRGELLGQGLGLTPQQLEVLLGRMASHALLHE